MKTRDWRAWAARMTEEQIRRRGVRDPRVLEALASLPRHRFVPGIGDPPSEEELDRAYGDFPLPLGLGQTLSQPYMVARMTELLEPREGMAVLDVGTGLGYQAAVLAFLGCSVVGVERLAPLADRAREVLEALGLSVEVRWADGRRGCPEGAPYGGILVAAACDRVEPAWEEQLAPQGRLVLPLAAGWGFERLLVRERTLQGFRDRWGEPCCFVPLREGVRDREEGV